MNTNTAAIARANARTQAITLIEAAYGFKFESWDYFAPTDVAVRPDQREAAARTWLWLQDIDADSERGQRERQRFMGDVFDAPLLIALTAPADEFLTWFACTDWAAFSDDDEPRPGQAGSKQWARGILSRARACIDVRGDDEFEQPLAPVALAH